MEKKEWVRPRAVVEEFIPNEYIAACGDSNTVYKFKCTAPGGPLYIFPNNDGNIDGIHDANDRKELLGIAYHPCDETHEASTIDAFYDGFVDYNWNGRCNEGEEVVVWRGPNGNNGHAMKQLDWSTVETAKS